MVCVGSLCCLLGRGWRQEQISKSCALKEDTLMTLMSTTDIKKQFHTITDRRIYSHFVLIYECQIIFKEATVPAQKGLYIIYYVLAEVKHCYE